LNQQTLSQAPAAAAAPPPRAPHGHLEHHVFRSRRTAMPSLRAYLPELWQRREFVYELAR
jgi:teichoic acid transport system permease protein